MRQINLEISGPPVLACGAWLKNTVCLARDGVAHLSADVGDLDSPAACAAHEAEAAGLLDTLRVEPAIVAHDLHPDFHSSRFAARFAAERGLPVVSVQHHHAHIAAVMAEHGVTEPVLGLALDGVGLGTDGKVWGGELLLARHDGEFERLGHLAELALPGGDRAAREPWRMAASVLHALGRGAEITARFAEPAATTVAQMLEKGLNAPPASSAGRWFDAAAGLLGVCHKMAFEAEAAIALEKLAEQHGPVEPMMDAFTLEPVGTLNLLPLMDALSNMNASACRDAKSHGAALFHATLAHGLAAWVEHAAERTGVRRVALGGGCFLNRILNRELTGKLENRGLNVMQPRQLSPGDAAISVGQAYAALLRWNSRGLPCA